jgi:3-methyladenine DNA glycosylase Tag
MSHEENIPNWVYTEDRPVSDEEYFKNLTRCIFQGGLNWTLIANKWPNFRESFDDFDINKIASYGLEKK